MNRASGILLHISSLPSAGGVGALGRCAHEFAAFLERAGQKYWQVLPVGPTSYGDSPYQSFSSFAGNPYFVDPETLCKQGLLLPAELAALPSSREVDYAALYLERPRLLRKAFSRADAELLKKAEAYAQDNQSWLDDYALFSALKEEFGGAPWYTWERALSRREPDALAQHRQKLAKEIQYHKFVQYLFDAQWKLLKSACQKHGVRIMGDLPFYSALDSADVWANPQWFQMDEGMRPALVAGVPPDYFSPTGQLWGNPVYDWDALREDGYGWWIRRIDACAQRFDALRIDHFRGFESFFAIPYGAQDARGGHWEPGPGVSLLDALCGWFPETEFIAEDLGVLTEEVYDLLAHTGWPGMKVLQFAFDSPDFTDYLPHTFDQNCVAYTGTHDNQTLSGWYQSVSRPVRSRARAYFGLNAKEGEIFGLLRGYLASPARLCVSQLQDWLMLGDHARMNTPSTLGSNWRWRLDRIPDDSLASDMFEMTRRYGR